MSKEEFQKEYTNFVKQHENEKLKIYDDGTGVPTIGIGFALINKVGKEWVPYTQKELKGFGINLSLDQYKIISEYAKTKSRGENTDSLKSRIDSISFSINSQISNNLLDYSINDKLNIIKNTIGEGTWNNLNAARKIGVMDHCFHKGNVQDIKDPLKSGDFNKASDIMRQTKTDSLKARHDLRADFVQHGKLTFDGIYIVKPGDILGKIAKDNNLKFEDLKKLNPQINDFNKLSIGQKINVNPSKESNDGAINPEYLQNPTSHADQATSKTSPHSSTNSQKNFHNKQSISDANKVPIFQEHTIKPGDTLWKIAKDHGTTVSNTISHY